MSYFKDAPQNAKAKINRGGIGREIVYMEHDALVKMPMTNADGTIYIDDIQLKPGARARVLRQVHGKEKTGHLNGTDQGSTEGGSWGIAVEFSVSGLEPSHVHFANLMVRDVDVLMIVRDGANRWRLAGEEGWPLVRESGGITLGTGENATAFAGGNYKLGTSQNFFPPHYTQDPYKLTLEVPMAQSVVSPTATDANLSWNTLEDTTINNFEVELATDADFKTIVQTNDVSNANTLAVTGLTANTLYFFRVKSKSAAGMVGLPSNPVKFQTAAS